MALLTNINGKFSVSDAGAVTFNNAFTFPTADGAANYVLQTNGSGQLAWALNGNGDISGSGTANTVTKFTGAKTVGNGPVTFSGNNSTFAGDITIGPKSNASITTSESGGATTKLMSASVGRSGTFSNHEYHLMQNSAVAVTIDVNKNVTFEAPVWIPDYIYHVGDPDTYFGFSAANEFLLVAGGSNKFAADVNAAYMYYQGGVKLQITSTGVTVNSTVSATSFLGDLNGTINTVTTATTKGNSTNDTTVATTAFVQNVVGTIPAGLVFQGTWNASTNSPTLTSGSGTTGHFYIVSVAGSTNLDGITDWQVGDWAVFIEQGASDQWEKIDNSSVLGGSGTGGSFAGWSGSGTSVTLGNAPVTFSGNDSTFAGKITASTLSIQNQINTTSSNLEINYANGDGTTTNFKDFYVRDGKNGVILNIQGSSKNATFAGTITSTSTSTNTLAGKLRINGTTTTGLEIASSSGSSSGLKLYNDSSNDHAYILNHYNGNLALGTNNAAVITLNGTTATFAGKIGIPDGSDVFWGGGYGNGAPVLAANGTTMKMYPSGSTSGIQFSLSPTVAAFFGNVGIGTASPQSKLHIETGSGGTYSPNVNHDDVTIEGSGNIGLQLFSPATSYQYIAFGDPGSVNAGYLRYYHGTNEMVFRTNGSDNMVINSAGNVGIGTTSPTNYKLEVNGNVKGDSFGTDQSTTARIFAPSGAAYNGSGTQTGYLIIKLPDNGAGGVNNMMSGLIRVFDYAGNESFDVHFAGYWYSGYNWTNCTAWIESQSNIDRNFNVRFGAMTGAAGSGTRPYITIGEGDSTWSYCKFSVMEYTSGHSNAALYKWNSGWEMALSSTAPGVTARTVANCQGNNWAREGQNIYYGSGTGNVGIGTYSPDAKLQVNVGSAMALYAGNACGHVGIGVTSTDISGNGLQPQLTVKGNISYGYNNYSSVANTWSNALNFSGYPAGLYQVNICKQSNASAYIIAQVKWSGTAGTVINTVTSFQYGITFSGTQLQSIINTTTATSISVQCLVTFESCLP